MPRALAILLAAALAAAALALAPLPRALDPRLDELPASAYGELQRFSDTLTRPQVEAALRLIDPEGALAPYLDLTDRTVAVRVDRSGPPAVQLSLRAEAAPPRRWSRQRIALDAGHAGGAWSQIEQRHTDRGAPPVREGDLNWATARLVERGLAARGQEVHLLRGPPPAAPYPAGADPAFDPAFEARLWLATHTAEIPWLTSWRALGLWRERSALVSERPFELYTHFDLRRRAAVAAASGAEVTLSLHHDICHDGRNGIFVFVPGSFLASELVTPSQRLWALRRALDGSLDETVRLAGVVADQMMRHLALPALSAAYADRHFTGWLPVDVTRGIYARNLAIPRRTPGVVLVLEGPCMNDPVEYRRLQGTELEIDGRRYPARVRDYATAVIEALAPPPP